MADLRSASSQQLNTVPRSLHPRTKRLVELVIATLACLSAVGLSSAAQPELLGTVYQPDRPFPRFLPLWSEGWAIRDAAGDPVVMARDDMPLGAHVQAYVFNPGPETVTVGDVAVEGVSLTEAIVFAKEKTSGFFPASVKFSNLPQDARDRLSRAGEPVWWKVDPPVLPPGATAELTLRLRRAPAGGEIRLTVAAGKTELAATCHTKPPLHVFSSITCPDRLDSVTLIVQGPRGRGDKPSRLLIDGADVSANARVEFDAATGVTVAVVRLDRPFERASYHTFRAIFQDSSAIAGVRCWRDDFVYGMWGYLNQGETPEERARFFLNDLHAHNLNAIMYSYTQDVRDLITTPAGREYFRSLGMRAMLTGPGRITDPICYFLMDEPDAHDFAVRDLPPMERLGSLGQALVQHARQLREEEPSTPHMLNIDNTYKPENWYMYARLADICCADPYYQEQQKIVWNERPGWAGAFTKPTYVQAVSTICHSTCAPRPLHIILNSVRHDNAKTPFRFATPAEKRVELYYALGSGVRGISYWWYTPYDEFYGVGGKSEDAAALYREIGRLGAEARTVGPLLLDAAPVELSVRAPARLWVRTLLSGHDSVVLFAVNEGIASDRQGTVVVPIEKADVEVALPAWLRPDDAFEVTAAGIRDVDWKDADGHVSLAFGRTQLTRLVVLTRDASLRKRLADDYARLFASKAASLAENDAR